MSFQEDGTVRVAHDYEGNHPWKWLATIVCAVIICFAAVTTAGTFINGGLLG
jgi:hypothetical protein